jgi:Kinesin motor domain
MYLGDVLNTLSKPSFTHELSESKLTPTYVPYRNSKLTMLLKDSLGGNSKSLMIATIRQNQKFYQQTMMTLRYASRAKLIHCNPMQNIQTVDSSDTKMLRQAMSEVTKLKKRLDNRTVEYQEVKARLQELEAQKLLLLSNNKVIINMC